MVPQKAIGDRWSTLAATPPDVSDVPVVITEPDLVETPSEVCWASVILKIADAPLVLQGSLGSQLPASAPNGTNGDVGAWVHTGGSLHTHVWPSGSHVER